MTGISIFGAGGHGRVVADVAECCGYATVEFIDKEYPDRKDNLHWKVVGNDFGATTAGFERFVAIGNNGLRLKMLEELFLAQWVVPCLIHPGAIVSRYASVGAGSVVMPGVVINAGAKLGAGVVANTGCTIDHDCVIDDGAHISPGANIAGGVRIGRRSWIGIGTSVREMIEVGSDCVVGAGSVVVGNVADGTRVMGIPAK
jgi:sugar O-acyltransferase (sialic acid O-acetyltransferase NeuD family)